MSKFNLIIKMFIVISLTFLFTKCEWQYMGMWSPLFGDEEIVIDDPPIEDYLKVVVNKNSFVLLWDSKEEVDYYNVYYRKHNTKEWTFLASVNEEEIEICSDLVSFSTWNFAVTAVINEKESEKHTSLDENAYPSPWYLEWNL